MNIAKEIKDYISDNNISQNKLAEKANIGEVQLCRALNGYRKLTAEEYVNICEALCVPLERFVSTTPQAENVYMGDNNRAIKEIPPM